jgi:hypothetical protein
MENNPQGTWQRGLGNAKAIYELDGKNSYDVHDDDCEEDA